jgi:hypothetical protein
VKTGLTSGSVLHRGEWVIGDFDGETSSRTKLILQQPPLWRPFATSPEHTLINFELWNYSS